ncbi:plasminogen activator inhibitor 1 RNA-binding protein-like [Stegodyphus dumicola]|uniref:plasminogen activator inhibitor 1 RNA-binding protein-like n=1 Tax=Stegodyphus dumicola TaxID=202533 RepID=UPI0015A928D8|nr:plasminogen activator inhibitor 1 RNA-binding protein-like [Stegodyphus dumicola]
MNEIVELAKQTGVDEVNVDVEEIMQETATSLSNEFKELADKEHKNIEIREREGESRRGRGGFRGRGRSRGRGNFFGNFEGRPRREFDRHSRSDKSGLRPVEKRDVAGPGNWGDLKSEFNSRRREAESTWMDEEFDASGDKQNDSCWKEILPTVTEMPAVSHNELTAEKCGDTTVPESMDSKENEPVTEERPEEGLREMTLDEWKRQQEAKRAVPKYNLRKPGEGEDGNQWKKLYMLKKKAKEDDDEEVEDDDEDVDDEEFARRGRHRQLVDIQINFNDSRRGRGRGRGVRGVGPRSGGGSMGNKDSSREERREMGSSVSNRSFGRGSAKVKSGHQSAPKVDDWNDFPSLVTA